MSNDIRNMIDKIKNLKQSVNENLEQNNVKIEINPIESDERSSQKQLKSYQVNYQIIANGQLIEIDGVLTPYNTGRRTEYKFEPSNFLDDETEQYYNYNWENIESDIFGKLNN
jgi:hypothetical protein